MPVSFGSNDAVPTNTESNVLDFTNNTGGDIILEAIGGEATTRSEWFIYVDNVLKIKRRASTPNPNIDIDLHRIKLSDIGNIKVNVKHYISGNQKFSAELRYSDG
jgi:hypothetical protein